MTKLKSKILAIDYGTKTIGIAITDDKQNLSLPYCEIKNDAFKFKKISEIVNEENIFEVIIGFPKTINNYVSQRHQLINQFKKELSLHLKKTKIIFFNEAYSSKTAHDSLKKFNVKTSKLQKNKDMIAASIILENYLNSKIE